MTPVAKRPVFEMFEVTPEVTFETTGKTPLQRLVSEIADYKSQQRVSGVPVLEYWQRSKYPMMKQLAKGFLCCQPASVPSERSFSDSGYQMWDRRSK